MRLWRFQAVASRGFCIPFLVSRILFGISSCSFLAFAMPTGLPSSSTPMISFPTLRVGESANPFQVFLAPALLVLDVLVFLVHFGSCSRDRAMVSTGYGHKGFLCASKSGPSGRSLPGNTPEPRFGEAEKLMKLSNISWHPFEEVIMRFIKFGCAHTSFALKHD